MNAMIEKMLSRHAIRRFRPEQISEDDLDQILQAGLYAPSAGNNQNSRIVVCQDAALNDQLGRINRYMQFKGREPASVAHAISAEQPSIQDDFTILSGYYGAPTVLTLFTRNHKYRYEDAAMMGENMLLAAHFLGLGACYVGRTDEVFATEFGMECRRSWGVPDDLFAAANVLLGYVDGDLPHAKPRRPGRILRAGAEKSSLREIAF